MKKYKVIWFDDECNLLPLIKENAYLNDIVLIGFDNAEDGIKELEVNVLNYDAAVVDGIFFRKHEQQADAKNQNALADVALAIERLKDRKKLPWFILSGQTSFTKEKNSLADAFKDNKVFDKLSDEDLDSLWRSLKTEADRQVDTQIRHDHQEIFSIFSSGYLPAEIELQVLELIKADLPANRVSIKSLLSNIRSIHESCFLKLEGIGIIPDTSAKFNTIIRHLSGNKDATNGFQCTTKEYQNDAIENLNKWLYFTCGKYIHNLRDENYNGYMISKYAVESLRTGLLELLLWFKKTYEENK